jgi:hypothetical protein
MRSAIEKEEEEGNSVRKKRRRMLNVENEREKIEVKHKGICSAGSSVAGCPKMNANVECFLAANNPLHKPIGIKS